MTSGVSRTLVRPATAADADAIAEIHHLGWTEGYAGLLPASYLGSLSLAACRNRWRDTCAGGAAVDVLVACDSESVVGFVSVGRCADPGVTSAGEVWDLWVRPGQRSRGYGGALLAAGLDVLAKTCPVAVVWVLAANSRGRAFYERAGAVPTGLSRIQPIGEGTMTDVRYGWDLRSRHSWVAELHSGLE